MIQRLHLTEIIDTDASLVMSDAEYKFEVKVMLHGRAVVKDFHKIQHLVGDL